MRQQLVSYRTDSSVAKPVPYELTDCFKHGRIKHDKGVKKIKKYKKRVL